jgi:hypothetical protein
MVHWDEPGGGVLLQCLHWNVAEGYIALFAYPIKEARHTSAWSPIMAHGLLVYSIEVERCTAAPHGEYGDKT